MAASEVIGMSGEAPFSELLRQQRRAAGYSQEDLAERLRRAPHRETADVADIVYRAPRAGRSQGVAK